MDNDIIKPLGKAVTVVVSRKIHPGRERDYYEWARKLVIEATKAPGNTGATMLIPEPGKTGLHHLVLRFADHESVQAWENSAIRRELSNEADAFSTMSRQEATGLETWFSIPGCPELAPPPQWKMFLITFGAVYLLTSIIVPLQQRFIQSWPFAVENILTCVLLVGILTWAVMPWLSRRVFRKWLYRE
jgi:uncharacterized protein